MRANTFIIATTCGALGFFEGRHRQLRQHATSNTEYSPASRAQPACEPKMLAPAVAVLSTPTKLALPRRWGAVFLVAATVGVAALLVATIGSMFSSMQRVTCAAASATLMSFIIAMAPRRCVRVPTSDGYSSDRRNNAIRWADTAGPRLQVVTLTTLVVLIGYWSTETFDLSDREIGVITSLIGAALTVIALALSDVVFSHRQEAAEQRRRHEPALRLLLAGEPLVVSSVALTFTALAQAPNGSGCGIVDEGRASAAIEIYRITRSPRLIRPLVIEALRCL